MDTARRRRLVAYFAGLPFKGDRSKLIAKTGFTKGRIAQYFNKDQPFGERAARTLAGRLGLPLDFFEHDQGDHPPIPNEDLRLQDALRFISESMRGDDEATRHLVARTLLDMMLKPAAPARAEPAPLQPDTLPTGASQVVNMPKRAEDTGPRGKIGAGIKGALAGSKPGSKKAKE